MTDLPVSNMVLPWVLGFFSPIFVDGKPCPCDLLLPIPWILGSLGGQKRHLEGFEIGRCERLLATKEHWMIGHSFHFPDIVAYGHFYLRRFVGRFVYDSILDAISRCSAVFWIVQPQQVFNGGTFWPIPLIRISLSISLYIYVYIYISVFFKGNMFMSKQQRFQLIFAILVVYFYFGCVVWGWGGIYL